MGHARRQPERGLRARADRGRAGSAATRYVLAATGFLGAFTTFSTWVVDARLLGARLGGANLAVALVLGLLAVWLGRELGALL